MLGCVDLGGAASGARVAGGGSFKFGSTPSQRSRQTLWTMRRSLGPARGYGWVVVFILALACSPYESSKSSPSLPSRPTPTPGTFTLIPSDPLTTWSPGISRGVPARTTGCGNVSAAHDGH